MVGRVASPIYILGTSISWAKNIGFARIGMNLDIDDTSTSNWSPPKGGRVKVNSDGSVVIETGTATIGGVIRNAQGVWLLGFSQKIGNIIVCQAEARALLQGIHGYAERNRMTAIREIQRLGKMHCHIVFRHISRQQNTVADGMERLGQHSTSGLHAFIEPPRAVLQPFEQDKHGMLSFW
ncbi:hypothetical protein PVK06_017195 [Gossypium arboreum]|uniref:RNase H type-1 domain-containing protein n=1 Tax=Gossypium arboreum TaxID=29729 RepID=A0ABR0Q233_GOSAR|nr:hypothetical protein PVK06_017195 [Gossypium arboreum]